MTRTRTRGAFLLLLLIALTFPLLSPGQEANRALTPNAKEELELSRPVRPWEFVSATGTRAALFGNESGRLEAWVYPLKILRDFHLRFHSRGLDFPAESLARTITVHPESASILYSGDTFTVRETLFVPVHEPGAIIQLEVDAAEPVEIKAEFQRDFQLEWPGAFAGSYSYWDEKLHAFVFADELNRFSAMIGSPTGELSSEEYWTNYSASSTNSFRLGATSKGRSVKLIVIAAAPNAGTSSNVYSEAEAVYHRLSVSYSTLLNQSAEYYRAYLDRTVEVSIPDQRLQTAYDWARVSMIQGLVDNPFLGSGLVAGYRASGDSQRPGFAWFFGRDALWTSLALDAAGDFTTTRTELDFLSKYQRDDGKIPHEVSQAASFAAWFKDYPYPYASADATPLFIIVMNDYVTGSGDVAYAKDKWTNIWKAYEYLRSTYDAQGFPQNGAFGHGWVEGGPLLPVKTEIYQSGLGLEALRALSHLALMVDKKDISDDLHQQFERQRTALNNIFWSADRKAFAYALDKDGRRLDTTSVLATVSMWFGLLDEDKAEATIDQLADSDQQTDWGMRILSARDPRYNPGGYHYGSVWPLFTGWAATGEYRYHRVFPAYSNLRSNALLGLDGSLGHVTETLSGGYYQPLLGASPHQIWSAAMVVNPLLRGLLGIQVDAAARHLVFAPHVPFDWTSFQVGNLHVESVVLNLKYARTPEGVSLDVRRTGSGDCTLEFAPALSLRAQIVGVELNGHPIAFHIESNSEDQHVTVQFPVSRSENKLRIRLRDDFGLSISQELPPLGESSRGLRILSESWSPTRDQLTLEISGSPGRPYEIAVWNPTQITSVDGAQLVSDAAANVRARVQFQGADSSRQITFHFKQRNSRP
ncbi:MAG: amylo-alpha-1,6-glucosidase [Terriglobales bacterium]